MCERFHAQSAYADVIPFDAESMAATLEATISHPDGAVYFNGDACLGAVRVPCPWNFGHIISTERFWWSDKPKAGLAVLNAFEAECGAFGAHALMVRQNDDVGQRLDGLFKRRGYIQAETYYFKPRGL